MYEYKESYKLAYHGSSITCIDFVVSRGLYVGRFADDIHYLSIPIAYITALHQHTLCIKRITTSLVPLPMWPVPLGLGVQTRSSTIPTYHRQIPSKNCQRSGSPADSHGPGLLSVQGRVGSTEIGPRSRHPRQMCNRVQSCHEPVPPSDFPAENCEILGISGISRGKIRK